MKNSSNQKTVSALRVYVRQSPIQEWRACGKITPAQRERNEKSLYRLGWKYVRYVEICE